MKTIIPALAVLLLSVGGAARAQEKHPASPTLRSVLDEQLSAQETDFVAAAEAMPEEKYAFVPASGEFKGVRTFALEIRHVAFANHVFYGPVLGERVAAAVGRD